MSSQWEVATDAGTVTVWAESEAQARSRGKWKAVCENFTYAKGSAAFLCAVRDCEVLTITQRKEN